MQMEKLLYKKEVMKITSNQGLVDKKVLYAQAVYGDEEINAVIESLKNGWLAAGPLVAKFEQEVAYRFGKKYGIAVNSGSSANLLALQAATKISKGMRKGVITPACTFSTTISSIVLNPSHLHPILVDVKPGSYVIDEKKVEDLFKDYRGQQAFAILVPQLIGSVCDMVKLREIADEYGLILIDDSCDTFAPELHGKKVAEYADITTTSFYGSHIITAMGFGGMIMTDSEIVRDTCICLRDWGRVGNDREDFESRFNFDIQGIPYDAKFLYTEMGFNLKMNEGAAAFGLEQLKKLEGFMTIRNNRFSSYLEFFKRYEKYFIVPDLLDGAKTGWLAFPLTVRADAPFTRYDILKRLEQASVQTRVLFSGNISRHPAYSYLNDPGKFPVSDDIMRGGFLLGAHQGLDNEQVKYVTDVVESFLKEL